MPGLGRFLAFDALTIAPRHVADDRARTTRRAFRTIRMKWWRRNTAARSQE